MTRVEITTKTEEDSVERKVAGFSRNSAEYFRGVWKVTEVAVGTVATIALGIVSYLSASYYGPAFFAEPISIKMLAASFILVPAIATGLSGAYTVSRIRN